ncbi:MAG: nucleotidyl transferase AbiEii/AbiGii toxin family protein [Coriobacteriia bacterium]|nr:nucleotidyl transferase AbiEii/AbiGii toxin family protein [Coriobacteriia bacterium]MCL2749436.1 nucleotidyl transferase AbiEii/AbiGii toxin family protein [Coriobacteriia bacterium]
MAELNPIIQQMLNDRTEANQPGGKRVIHEVLQQIILAGLYRGGFFDKAAFYGGTCLRLFYDLQRFSEDLDFSLLAPDQNFDLTRYFDAILTELSAYGCEAEIKKREKTRQTAIESAFLKSDTALYNLEAEVQGKVTLKIEVDTNPPGGFSVEPLALLEPFTFLVSCYVLPDLYAGKMNALFYRQWQSRVKGRDWYDFIWYVRRNIALNLEHFNIRAGEQSLELFPGPFTQDTFLLALQEKIESTDLVAAREEVRPFVRNSLELEVWSKDFFMQLVDKIRFL